jgi:hypothetical protein
VLVVLHAIIMHSMAIIINNLLSFDIVASPFIIACSRPTTGTDNNNNINNKPINGREKERRRENFQLFYLTIETLEMETERGEQKNENYLYFKVECRNLALARNAEVGANDDDDVGWRKNVPRMAKRV